MKQKAFTKIIKFSFVFFFCVATFYTPDIIFEKDIAYGMDSAAVRNQLHFRFRNDNGSETTATWKAAEDINVANQLRLTNFRLRISSAETNSASPSVTFTPRIAYKAAAGASCSDTSGWTVISTSGASNAFVITDSPHFSYAVATTEQLSSPGGGYSFTAGQLHEASGTASTTAAFSKGWTEHEWVLQATANATYGTAYIFRLTNAGTAYNLYDACPRFTVATAPHLSLEHYRWRNDNGSQSAATWGANDDTATTSVRLNTNIRLRFQMYNTGETSTTTTYRLEYAPRSGTCDTAYSGESYVQVPNIPTTEHFNMAASIHFADGDTTTEQLAGSLYPFLSGRMVESPSNSTGSFTFNALSFTEIEYVFQANSNVTSEGVYCFRMTSTGGIVLNTTNVVAQLTMATLTPNVIQDHYRWRNDDGSETAATWGEAEDTATTTIAKNTSIRLRFQVDNSGSGTATSYQYNLEYAARSGTCDTSFSGETYAIVPNVPDSAPFTTDQIFSSHYADTLPTTLQLSNGEAYTFTAGTMNEDSSISNANTLTSNRTTEFEYILRATDTATASGNYCFRLTKSGTPLDQYDVVAELQMTADANSIVDHYRWRNDDGSETTATWGAAEDTATSSVPKSSNIRLRFQVDNSGTGAYNNRYYALEYSAKSGTCDTSFSGESYVAVPVGSSEHFTSGVLSSNYADLDPTTLQLSNGEGYTFVTGTMVENLYYSGLVSLTQNRTTEVEFVIQATTNATAGGSYCFRLTQFTTDPSIRSVLHQYDVVAELQVDNPQPNTIQDHYRWRNDDGSESAATWGEAEDTATSSVPKSSNIRLRFQIDNTGAGSATNYNYTIEWSAKSGTCDTSFSGESYVAIPDSPTTEHFDMVTSTQFADGDSTTAQLSNGESHTFIDGKMVESPSNASGGITTSQNQTTEVEFVFKANSNATTGGSYCFRVTDGGTELDQYDVVAEITLAIPNTIQDHYRWRNDDGSESAATWGEAEDTATSSVPKSSNIRLRFQIDNTGTGSAINYNYTIQYAVKSGTCDTDFTGESYITLPDSPTTEHFDMVTSTQFADGDSTTAQLSNGEAYTFIDGKMVESPSNASGGITISNSQTTEVEFVFKANSNSTAGGSYCFRVTDGGTALDQYDVVAELQISTNVLPIASSVSIDSGVGSITLTENTTKTVSCAGTVTDDDGFSDITSVTADFYRTDAGTSNPLSNSYYYQLVGDANCVPSGGSGNSETYTCDFSVQFYADPTDSGSEYTSSNWTCDMTPSDSVGAGTSASDTIEMDSLLAISVTASIDFGSIDANTDTGASNETTVVTNTGNRSIDNQLSGTDMTSGGDTLVVGQQKYSDSGFTYSSGGIALTTTPTTIVLALPTPQSTTTPITDNVLWGIGIPNGQPAGTYTGTNTFTAIGD